MAVPSGARRRLWGCPFRRCRCGWRAATSRGSASWTSSSSPAGRSSPGWRTSRVIGVPPGPSPVPAVDVRAPRSRPPPARLPDSHARGQDAKVPLALIRGPRRGRLVSGIALSAGRPRCLVYRARAGVPRHGREYLAAVGAAMPMTSERRSPWLGGPFPVSRAGVPRVPRRARAGGRGASCPLVSQSLLSFGFRVRTRPSLPVDNCVDNLWITFRITVKSPTRASLPACAPR